MKIALATTTIHVPHALKLMRKCSEDVKFFVALDKNSDFNGIALHMENDWDSSWLTPDFQGTWKCSGLLGWNTLARRNIAFLEALKWGADVIYSWDDDNLPLDLQHFRHIETAFYYPPGAWAGLQVGGYAWFDPGQLLIPPTRHRGFPYIMVPQSRAEPIVDAKIGVATGLVIGDPDIDAVTRMEKSPDIGSVHILGSVGVVVDPHTWTIFNTQNTAVLREFVPAWFMMPNVGRHDDIYASLIVQRVMRERGYCVHFGQPFTYQQRNPHNLVKDLRAEIDGMDNVLRLANLLDSIVLLGKSVIDDTRTIYQTLAHVDWLPPKSIEAGLAFIDDCESIGL